jgi:predicted nucleotidyltransferase
MGRALRGYLGEVCKRLIEYDRDIVEIVQFGSSVYAPELSRDVDLLVVTKRVKEYEGYLDVANSGDSPVDVDVLVFSVDDRPKEELLRAVLGAFEVLYGSGEQLLRYARELGNPTFEEAKSSLRVASSLLRLALETSNPLDRDRLCREAFDALFHAARIASMVYLSIDVGRGGLIKRGLPEPFKKNFNEFIRVLHIDFFYNGNYPKDKVEEEFRKWYEKVEKYIDDLEARVKKELRGQAMK